MELWLLEIIMIAAGYHFFRRVLMTPLMYSRVFRDPTRQALGRKPLPVIDIQDWIDRLFSDNQAPRLNVRLRKLADIITFATAKSAGIPIDCVPACWKRPGGKACRGLLRVKLVPEKDEIRWQCPACGNQGAVTGWRGEFWDVTNGCEAL